MMALTLLHRSQVVHLYPNHFLVYHQLLTHAYNYITNTFSEYGHHKTIHFLTKSKHCEIPPMSANITKHHSMKVLSVLSSHSPDCLQVTQNETI